MTKKTLADYIDTGNGNGFKIHNTDDESMLIIKTIFECIDVDKITGYNYGTYEQKKNGTHYVFLEKYEQVRGNGKQAVLGLDLSNCPFKVKAKKWRGTLKLRGSYQNEKFEIEFEKYPGYT